MFSFDEKTNIHVNIQCVQSIIDSLISKNKQQKCSDHTWILNTSPAHTQDTHDVTARAHSTDTVVHVMSGCVLQSLCALLSSPSTAGNKTCATWTQRAHTGNEITGERLWERERRREDHEEQEGGRVGGKWIKLIILGILEEEKIKKRRRETGNEERPDCLRGVV